MSVPYTRGISPLIVTVSVPETAWTPPEGHIEEEALWVSTSDNATIVASKSSFAISIIMVCKGEYLKK